MRRPPITIRCECGESRDVAYGELWRCERCGRSWNTQQIPAEESGQPLVVVNVAEVPPTPWTLLGYGYIEKEELQDELRKPAELAHSLAVQVERLRVCSPHPIDALLEVVAERNPGVLVFGPDRSRLKPRTYRRAARKIGKRVTG